MSKRDREAPRDATTVIVRAVRPTCSLCFKAADRTIEFIARSVRNGQPVQNRGGARKVRLCVTCVRELSEKVGAA